MCDALLDRPVVLGVRRPTGDRRPPGRPGKLGAAVVRITGDTAFAISYLQILVPDRVGPLFDVPNHGSSRGFHVHRVAANRWDFVRTDEGWRIKRRTLRPLDGMHLVQAVLGATQ
jgi:hypothetical protein